MLAQNMINWFEIAVTDFERARNFYQTVFDIEMNVTEMQGYKMAFFPNEEGGVSGAICYGEGYIPSGAGALLYLNANPDVNLVLDRTVQAGGKIIVPKTLIGEDAGYYAFIVDTEGNRLALHSKR
ncbi:MAG TPA: VOC family protein [Chitinophagaceae bacterium]|jgi:predicted enzyme related to lactoylglutathione lyase|nr:VOC family protein [Chitinophagaceae bacterium]